MGSDITWEEFLVFVALFGLVAVIKRRNSGGAIKNGATEVGFKMGALSLNMETNKGTYRPIGRMRDWASFAITDIDYMEVTKLSRRKWVVAIYLGSFNARPIMVDLGTKENADLLIVRFRQMVNMMRNTNA